MDQGGGPPQGGPPAAMQAQATGPTPATMPAQNQGLQAAALARLAVLVQALQTTILPMVPVGSDAGRDIREALNKLAKHVPPGAVSQGIQNMSAQQMALQQKQNAPQIAAMRASQMSPPAQPAAPPQMAA